MFNKANTESLHYCFGSQTLNHCDPSSSSTVDLNAMHRSTANYCKPPGVSSRSYQACNLYSHGLFETQNSLGKWIKVAEATQKSIQITSKKLLWRSVFFWHRQRKMECVVALVWPRRCFQRLPEMFCDLPLWGVCDTQNNSAVLLNRNY